jgi:glucosamine-6-phosphate deaminase
MVEAPLVLTDASRVAVLGGELVANRLRARPRLRLILPTGHTPLGLYEVLRAHAEDESLPTKDATLLQLDEYLGLGPDDERSFGAYLRRELEGVVFGTFRGLDGSVSDPDAACSRHQALLDAEPVDLAILGIGRDGHVAFDEPGSALGSGVRRVRLHAATRVDASEAFGGLEHVPREALTVGIGTLLAARELVLLATGEAKARALRAMLEEPPGPDCPASMLREHPRLTVICDRGAARLLAPQSNRRSDRAVVVLGHREAGVSAEHRVSDETRARLRRAERACRQDTPRVVLFTGYSRTQHGLSEAEQMKAAWTLPEVPALMEDAGRNTAENASRSLPLILAIGELRRVTVVTSAWHIRARYFFAVYRKLGLRVAFAWAVDAPSRRVLWHELYGLRTIRAQRARAMAQLRLPRQHASSGPTGGP